MIITDEELARYKRSRSYRKHAALLWLFAWAMYIPLLNVAAVFWYGVFDEGLMSTIKPRWGLLTFHFLNDGLHPTLWHTWKQITGRQQGKYTGIWTPRAPRNKTDADAITAYYHRIKRALDAED